MASSGRGRSAILALYELLYVYEGQVCCEEEPTAGHGSASQRPCKSR